MRPSCCSSLVPITVMVVVLAATSGSAWSNGGYSADLGDPDYGTHDGFADRSMLDQLRN